MGFSNWSTFFANEVGACATLTGLVIVAVSINLTRILAVEHLPGRAAESLFGLTAALTISAVALFPGLPDFVFGALALILGAATLAAGVRNQILAVGIKDLVSIERQIISGLGRLISSGPMMVGGALLVAHLSQGAGWIATGVVATLAVAVMSAWVLLVEILR